MEAVTVRLLSGKQFAVPCQPGASVADIKRCLAAQDGGPKRCRLTLRGAMLGEDVLVESLGLRPGEFLVAFETRKKKAATPAPSTAAAAAGDHHPSAAASPGSPRRHLPPQPLASPNKLDSLLPGYLSRPNASPVKSSMLRAPPVPPVALGPGSAAPAGDRAVLRLPPPPAGTSQHQPAQLEGRGKGPAAKRAKRTLLDLATLQYGSSDSRAGDAAPASAAGRAALFTQWQAAAAEPAAKAAPRLAAAHPEAGPAARERDFARDRVQPQSLLPPPQQPQQQAQQALFDDLRAELLGAEEMPLQQPRLEKEPAAPQAAQHEGSNLHERPAPAAGAPTDGGAVEAAACGKPQRRPSRGAGSTRKQQPARASPGPASLLALSEPELDAAAAALPLPPLAEQLEASFLALSQLHEFLLRTHIQATWKNVREAAEGMRLRQPLTLPDCELIAALCPELVSVQQHHRVVPRSYRDSWRAGQISSPQKVRAAVAAAAAAEAAAGGADQPLPNPMHLRSDGAGTVLEPAALSATAEQGTAAAAAAEDDTKVIDVVDPGRGFLTLPIPAAFLSQLRRRAAAAGNARAAAGSPEATAQEAGAEGTGDEEAGDVSATAAGAAGGAPAAAADGLPAGRRPAIRVNRLTRQRWCFRRALMRALLLVQQQQVGTAAVTLPKPHVVPAQLGRRADDGARSAVRTAPLDGQSEDEQPAIWHPGFDPASVTAAQLAAAGDALSAPTRAAATAAEQEAANADALQAARRLTGAGGAASSAAVRGGREQPAAGGKETAVGQRAAARPPQLMKQHAPCTDTTQMDSQQFLAHLQSLPWYQGQVVHIERLAARQAAHQPPATPLAPPVAAALQLRGVRRLFTHQAAAMDHLMQGRHTVVATSTASGKSLCYSVPILQALAQDRSACALLMFPTKALAQDQLRALRELAAAVFGFGEAAPPAVHVYDGDTPMGEREAIRSEAQLLITNPDMLHMSVLPVHQQFGRLLASLKYVVVDEGHAYKGVFGCHTALVLRRLRRLCERVYQSQPTFAVTTATVANPAEHARELLGVEHVAVVDEDGSPHGPKTFVMWNPPLRQGGPPGGLTRTEERARGGERRSRRATVAQRQRARQQANQERGDGVLYGASAGAASGSGNTHAASVSVQTNGAPLEAEQLAAAKLSRRRRQLEAAVEEQEPSGTSPPQQPARQQRQAQQHSKVQAPAGQEEQAGGAGPATAGSQWAQQGRLQAGQQPKGHLPPALQREVAAAAAAIAAVGGSSSRQPRAIQQQGLQAPRGGTAGWGAGASTSVPLRPLIRRRAVGARSSLQQMAGGSSSGSNMRGGSTDSGRHQAARRPGAAHPAAGGWRDAGQPEEGGEGVEGEEQDEDESYRARLPTSMQPWLDAQEEQAAEGAEPARGPSGPRFGRQPGGGAGEEGEGEDERRSSPIVEISLLLAECVQHGLRTIAFCKSRKLCELVTAYVREILKCTAPQLAGSIAVYRAGYSPSERREIERALFQGDLRAVAATNALELGVDVGSLDCTLHLGFPGSVASFWQQAGRAGRREQHSLGIYLGWDGPLDQYFMRHPAQLFGRPIEKAMVDAHNPSVLDAHAACAAAEAPLLLDGDQRYFGPSLPAVAARLQAASLLGRHPLNPTARALHYIGAVGSPASKVSLRAIDPERYAIVDESQGGALLEEIEESKAFFEVYDGAVYMYQGRTYLCKKLDLDARVAVVRPADLKYYTKCIDYTDVHVRGGKAAYMPAMAVSAADPAAGPAETGASTAAAGPGSERQAPPAEQGQQAQARALAARCSPALVTTRWLGFRRVWRGTGEVFDTVDLFVPDVQFETQAAYLRLPRHVRQRLKEAGLPFRDGVHAACHALLNVLPLFLMCNPSDMGAECDSPWDSRFRPERLLLYDKHPGGIGLAAAAAPLFPELLRRALRLVRECDCVGRAGCPACVQHADCLEYNAVLHKQAAAALLEALLGEHEADLVGQQAGQSADSDCEAEGAAVACTGCAH